MGCFISKTIKPSIMAEIRDIENSTANPMSNCKIPYYKQQNKLTIDTNLKYVHNIYNDGMS